MSTPAVLVAANWEEGPVMHPSTRLLALVLILVAGPATAEIVCTTTTWESDNQYVPTRSTTRCRERGEGKPRLATARILPVEVAIDPKLDLLWKQALPYIKKTGRRKNIIRGKLGTVRIEDGRATLGSSSVALEDFDYREAAVWHLIQEVHL